MFKKKINFNKKRKAKSKSDKGSKSNDKEYDLDDRPYVPNTGTQFIDTAFEKGMGIDFYIDGARFLPDNSTVIKTIFEVYSIKGGEPLKFQGKDPVAAIPVLDTPAFNPVFEYRIELRKEKFDPTSTVLICIQTIDKNSDEVRIVGYSAINLFIARFTKKQPDNTNETVFNIFFFIIIIFFN